MGSGQDIRTQNVTAAVSIANVVKTSLGPVGLDKMLVDDIGDVTITNDGATILKQLEVEHPAARVLVELSNLQDQEVGDGTTSVVILAAELLKRANELVKNSIHPTTIMTGYRLAMKEAIKYIRDVLQYKVDKLGRDTALNIARTSLNSKIFGKESDHFANLAVEAMMSVKATTEDGRVKYPVKAVGVLKQHGKSSKDSQFLQGYALSMARAAQGMPCKVQGAKIALLDVDLRKAKMALGVQVLVNDPKQLDLIQQREMDITKERIQMMIKAGANVVLTTKGIDDMALKYFVESGAIACRRCPKEDLRRIAKITGGSVLTSFSNLEGDEDFVLIKGGKNSRSGSLLLRGANEQMLEEIHRSVHDAMCAVKRAMEGTYVVPGGGAVEAALSIYLENFATTLASREQLAVAEFAEALQVIPKTLAMNAAQDATDMVAKLRANHHAAQTDTSKADKKNFGLDVHEGKIRNNLEAGVIEPAVCKTKCIQFATEAAITILRIDDMIKLNNKDQAQGM